MKEVIFTEKSLKEFEIACEKALEAQHNTFVFKGNEYIVCLSSYSVKMHNHTIRLY